MGEQETKRVGRRGRCHPLQALPAWSTRRGRGTCGAQRLSKCKLILSHAPAALAARVRRYSETVRSASPSSTPRPAS